MSHLTTACPACGEELIITVESRSGAARQTADACACSFCKLSDENIRFLEIFVTSRGNIKEMERETGLGYWTIRNRLDQVIDALRLVQQEQPRQIDVDARRRAILVAVERGDLPLVEAERMLAELAAG